MTTILIIIGAILFWLLVYWIITRRIDRSDETMDASLDRSTAMVNACLYYAADNGKRNLANKHLRKRAQHFEREAAAAERRKARWERRIL